MSPDGGRLAWRDGELVSQDVLDVSASSACFRYGASVFDAARVVVDDGFAHVVALDLHLSRLRASAAAVGLELGFTDAELRKASHAVLRGVTSACTRTWGLRIFVFAVGETFHSSRSSTVIFALPLDDYGPDRPVRLRFADLTRAAAGDVPRWVKTPSAYLLGRIATSAARTAGFDDVLYRNEHGRVTESSRASLLVLHNDEIQVPPVAEGVLDGVTRRVVRRLAEQDGIGWSEQPVTDDDMARARGFLLTSSSLGVASVGVIEDRRCSETDLGRHLRDGYQSLYRDVAARDLVSVVQPMEVVT